MNLHLALGVISVTNISTVTFSKPFSLITSRSQTNTTDQTLHNTKLWQKNLLIWQFTTNLPTTAFILADLLCRVANLAMCVLYQNAFGQLSIKLLHFTAFGRNPIVIQGSVVTLYHSQRWRKVEKKRKYSMVKNKYPMEYS